MVQETGDGFGHRSKADHLRRSHECGAVKRLVRRAVPAQDGNRPQDLIPTGCIQLGWRREAERPAFALVKVGLVGLAALNQRPHPYQRSTAKRRAIPHPHRPCGSMNAAGMG